MTENAASHCTTRIDDNLSGHVGYQNKNNIMRLKDHKELDYTSDNLDSNVENGIRVWKGEICFKGGCLMAKYLNNPEANADSFEDGWFRTGDVGMLDSLGRLKIIDRIKNIFKLQQGEYVSPEAVEKVAATCPLVLQSFLTGNSNEANTVMVVIPEFKNVDKLLIKLGLITDETKDEMTYAQKVSTYVDQIKAEFHAQLVPAIKGSKDIKAFEKPHFLYITSEEMTVENDCMTPTFKIRRNFAEKKFAEYIKKM